MSRPGAMHAPLGKAALRQEIWNAIRAKPTRNSFTFTGIREKTLASANQVRDYVSGLVAAGYVEPLGQFAGWYHLVNDVGVEAPRIDRCGRPIEKGRPEEQMWRTLKFLRGEWSHHDLAVAASLEDSPVTSTQAGAYCAALAEAGYLAAAKAGRYRAIQAKIVGPLAPISARIRVVFDPNKGEIVWHQAVGQ